MQVANGEQQRIVAGVEMADIADGLVADQCCVSEAGSGVVAHHPEVALLGAGVILAVDDGGLELEVCGGSSGLEVADGGGKGGGGEQRGDDQRWAVHDCRGVYAADAGLSCGVMG